MKAEEIKKAADELIEVFKKETTFIHKEYAGANYSTFEHDEETLISCAIASTLNTIKVLEKLNSEEYKDFLIYNQQTEILNELKTRL